MTDEIVERGTMVEHRTVTDGADVRRAEHRKATAYAIALAGWVVPGLGHAILKMWGRAAACFLTVGLLVVLGAGMRGNIFAAPPLRPEKLLPLLLQFMELPMEQFLLFPNFP